MKKDYQTKAAPAATYELAMPDTVSVAMNELAETVWEGLLALAVGAGGHAGDDAGELHRGLRAQGPTRC